MLLCMLDCTRLLAATAHHFDKQGLITTQRTANYPVRYKAAYSTVQHRPHDSCLTLQSTLPTHSVRNSSAKSQSSDVHPCQLLSEITLHIHRVHFRCRCTRPLPEFRPAESVHLIIISRRTVSARCCTDCFCGISHHSYSSRVIHAALCATAVAKSATLPQQRLLRCYLVCWWFCHPAAAVCGGQEYWWLQTWMLSGPM